MIKCLFEEKREDFNSNEEFEEYCNLCHLLFLPIISKFKDYDEGKYYHNPNEYYLLHKEYYDEQMNNWKKCLVERKDLNLENTKIN